MFFYLLKHIRPDGSRTTILVAEDSYNDSPNPQDWVPGGRGTCVLVGKVNVVGEASHELDEVYHAER